MPVAIFSPRDFPFIVARSIHPNNKKAPLFEDALLSNDLDAN